MLLIVITGMRHAPKAKLTQVLIDMLFPKTERFALIDNSDVGLVRDGVKRQRLTGGCVCCSLSTALIPLVWRLEADYVLMPVSSSADPEALSFILDSLQSQRIQIVVVSLIDMWTQTQHPHLARKLSFYSDLQICEPFDFLEAADSIMEISPKRGLEFLPGCDRRKRTFC